MSRNSTPEKPFLGLLGEMENGRLARDLDGHLNKLVAAVRETRKKGKIKLVLEIAPTGKMTVIAEADIDVTLPEHDRPATTFFTMEDGSLSRKDPDQEDLPLRVVDMGDREPIKKVAE